MVIRYVSELKQQHGWRKGIFRNEINLQDVIVDWYRANEENVRIYMSQPLIGETRWIVVLLTAIRSVGGELYFNL